MCGMERIYSFPESIYAGARDLLPRKSAEKVVFAVLARYFDGVEPEGLSQKERAVYNMVSGRVEASERKSKSKRTNNDGMIQAVNQSVNHTVNHTVNDHDNSAAEREGVVIPYGITPPYNPPEGDDAAKAAEIDAIIDHFNASSGRKCSKKGRSARKAIRARLAEGYTATDCKQAIDNVCSAWLGTEGEQYVNIDTIFRASKFPRYLSGISRWGGGGDGADSEYASDF